MSIFEMNGVTVMDEAKWAKHYSSDHAILLVGEGDFSFALSLATTFGSASNIIATSLDPYEVVIKKYIRARTNLAILHNAGAKLLFGVDAMTMKLHPDLQWRKFDRIIYNFPHAGFFGKEDDQLVIDKHRYLVLCFFDNASQMLRPRGEVHVSHKTTPPFESWNIEELASRSLLSLLECVEFKIEDYPGYHNKRGGGCRPDDPFPLGKCSTFKFIASSASNISNIPHNSPHFLPPHSINNKECHWIFKEYFDQAISTFGIHDDYLCHSVRETLEIGFERCKMVNPINPLNEYIHHVKELREKSKERIAFLQKQLMETDCRNGLLTRQ